VGRLDSVALDVSSPVDLRQLAEEVVGSMAHPALSAGRTIALTGADHGIKRVIRRRAVALHADILAVLPSVAAGPGSDFHPIWRFGGHRSAIA